MSVRRAPIVAFAVLLAGACGGEPAGEPETSATEPAEVLWSTDTVTPAEIELGRRDSSWRQAVRLDRRFVVQAALDTVAIPEIWDDIGEEPALAEPPGRGEGVHLPLYGDVEGPSVLYVQVLLDMAHFSPGILDGKWGKNTEKAVYWLQRREGLPATGLVDSTTYTRIFDLAGRPVRFIRDHVLTEDDVAGPFRRLPASVYAQARLKCMCYESLAEKLAERFHASPAILAELNPEMRLDSLTAGTKIQVPNLDEAAVLPGSGGAAGTPPAGGLAVARVLVSGQGFYLHALDANGRILYHFPTTLGARYDPSPEGSFEVVSVTPDPWFLWQPRLLSGVDDSNPSTTIPPGPNSPVGRVWIKLSKKHYGIHGTREPATIGYETSSGCVRLTNWDALTLAGQLAAGVSVEFEDTAGQPPDSKLP